METTFKATYKATGPKKSSCEMTAPELPIELHQMILWAMLHQDEAATWLLPTYRNLRAGEKS